MTDTTTAPAFTEQQRVEWNALMDKMRELDEATHAAELEAGATLRWSLSAPGNEEYAMKRALEEAQQAVDFWAERMALSEQVATHPYQAVVDARMAARKAEREAQA